MKATLSKIKAVIFDMDGVLIDAKEWHYEALNKALRMFGLEISRYDHLTTFDGLPTKKKLEMLSIEEGLPQGLHRLINELKQLFTMEMVTHHCRPVFDHEYALSRLKNEGYRVAVCSNSIRDTVAAMMNKAQLSGYLDFFLSNQDVKKSKPHPEIYTKAFKRLKLQPDECLVLEDNENGVKAAKASGCHLMKVEDVTQVTYENIKRKIEEVEV
ncbi:HAD family phosphatase [Simkania negevensis]|uniref:HAD family phosphatase n=1 Tax=Simkania negevensis TaxID=83561 RepID=A0ABS3AQB2_9BACT|nr:HAD family phosphatase [Simkania negevensis]